MLLLGQYGIGEARVRQMTLPEIEIFVEAARALRPPYALPPQGMLSPYGDQSEHNRPAARNGTQRTLICRRKQP